MRNLFARANQHLARLKCSVTVEQTVLKYVETLCRPFRPYEMDEKGGHLCSRPHSHPRSSGHALVPRSRQLQGWCPETILSFESKVFKLIQPARYHWIYQRQMLYYRAQLIVGLGMALRYSVNDTRCRV